MFVIRILFITKQKSIQKKKTTTAHTKHTYVSNQVLPEKEAVVVAKGHERNYTYRFEREEEITI